MVYNDEIEPTFTDKIALASKSERTIHIVTHNPNTAMSGEVLYVRCPKLTSGMNLVSDSLDLVFDLTVSGNNGNTLVQNVSKNLFSRVVLKFQGEVLYDLTNNQLIETYRDLYKHSKERNNSILYGLSTDKFKSVQAGAVLPDANSDEELLYKIYGKKFAYKLMHPMVSTHGSIYPSALGSHIEWELTLADPKYLIKSPDGDMKYSLSNIQLEYETIQDADLSKRIVGLYNSGKSFLYEHVLHFRTSTWKQSDTILNENINVPRRSLKGIVLLSTMKQPQDTYDSEKFVNPQIESIEITIEGVANKLFSQGYTPRHLWKEARRYFGQMVSNHDIDMNEVKFLRDKFCLFIDLRSFKSIKHHGQGLRVINTKDGVQLQIKKKDTHVGDTDENIYTHIYVLSDAMLTVEGGKLKSIMY